MGFGDKSPMGFGVKPQGLKNFKSGKTYPKDTEEELYIKSVISLVFTMV